MLWLEKKYSACRLPPQEDAIIRRDTVIPLAV